MPKDSASRLRPISCRLCRSRKLRCSRDVPCSNCIARGVPCEQEQAAARPTPGGNDKSQAQLIERIQRLETLLENQNAQKNGCAEQRVDTVQTPTAIQNDRPSLPSQVEHLDKDIAWLGSLYDRQDFAVGQIPSGNVIFRICEIRQILGAPPFVNPNTPFTSTHLGPARCIWLPTHAEAKVLLNKYVQDVDHLYHIIYTPSLQATLDETYAQLNSQGQIEPGNLLLFLGMFALTTHCWAQSDCERGLFPTSTEANNQAPLWVKAVEDVLDIAHRTTRLSIEALQGAILASLVIANIEGVARRCKAMLNIALLVARDLGLNYLDRPGNANSPNLIQTEVGRRIWWHLAACDWVIGGRPEGGIRGAYQCHMRHMSVNKPRNINEEDVVNGIVPFERPLCQPTDMSYSLQRIRLAEISRNVADRTSLIASDSAGLSLDVVMDIDTELQSIIDECPRFFTMSIPELVQTYQMDDSRAAKIFYQGCMFQSCVNSQRCLLHFPFFSHRSMDSSHALSQQICLRSARLIVRMERQLERSQNCAVTTYKFFGLLLSIFLAGMVILSEMCINRASSNHDELRGEVIDALRILGAAKSRSVAAATFLDSLIHVLRKYKVCQKPLHKEDTPKSCTSNLQGQTTSNRFETPSTGHTPQEIEQSAMAPAASVPSPPPSISSNPPVDIFTTSDDLSSYFNELADGFGQGMEVGDMDWNSLFSGLTQSFI